MSLYTPANKSKIYKSPKKRKSSSNQLFSNLGDNNALLQYIALLLEDLRNKTKGAVRPWKYFGPQSKNNK